MESAWPGIQHWGLPGEPVQISWSSTLRGLALALSYCCLAHAGRGDPGKNVERFFFRMSLLENFDDLRALITVHIADAFLDLVDRHDFVFGMTDPVEEFVQYGSH